MLLGNEFQMLILLEVKNSVVNPIISELSFCSSGCTVYFVLKKCYCSLV